MVETRYDASGNLAERVVIDYVYDDLGRLKKEDRVQTDAAGATVAFGSYLKSFAYDAAGNRRTQTIDLNRDGTAVRAVTSTFDARDRQVEEVDVATDGTTTSTTTTTRTYDANGSTVTRFGSSAVSPIFRI